MREVFKDKIKFDEPAAVEEEEETGATPPVGGRGPERVDIGEGRGDE